MSELPGALVGERETAQPLLTLYDPAGRVELSGATTANWVAKSANLLVDGLGSPDRIGLLLPLHWQGVALLLAGVAADAEVLVAADPAGMAGADVVFTTVEHAAAVQADEVLVLSGHPLGAPLAPGTALPPLAQDYAREVPSYGDHYSGPMPATATVLVEGQALGLPVDRLGLTPADRVLTGLPMHTADGLGVVLAALGAGASLVLLPGHADGAGDAAHICAVERVTATASPGTPRLRRRGTPPPYPRP